MKKYMWIVILVLVFTIGGIVYFFKSNKKTDSNYSAEKTNLNNVSNNSNNNISNSTNNTSNTPLNNTTNIQHKIVEKEISSFSTKIKNKKDLNRQSNISITCSSLNNTIIKPNEVFSFCDTVGPATSDRGYKNANIIVKGTETKGLGGGNCQVSSTLYNSVLAVLDQLEVIERHPHSAPVPYIQEGKDAAVSYRYT